MNSGHFENVKFLFKYYLSSLKPSILPCKGKEVSHFCTSVGPCGVLFNDGINQVKKNCFRILQPRCNVIALSNSYCHL